MGDEKECASCCCIDRDEEEKNYRETNPLFQRNRFGEGDDHTAGKEEKYGCCEEEVAILLYGDEEGEEDKGKEEETGERERNRLIFRVAQSFEKPKKGKREQDAK